MAIVISVVVLLNDNPLITLDSAASSGPAMQAEKLTETTITILVSTIIFITIIASFAFLHRRQEWFNI